MSQPELDDEMFTNLPRRGKAASRASAPKRETSAPLEWKRVHTEEKCADCITEMYEGRAPMHAAMPAVYVRTKGDERVAVCWEHAIPRRSADGLKTKRKRG